MVTMDPILLIPIMSVPLKTHKLQVEPSNTKITFKIELYVSKYMKQYQNCL